MPLFSKSKKKEKPTTNSGNTSVTNGQHVVHVSSSFTEQTVTTQRTETHATIHTFSSEPVLASSLFNPLTDRNSSSINYNLNSTKSLLSSSSSYRERKDSLPTPLITTKPTLFTSVSTDATPFKRTGLYASTPPRSAFSGNPLSTSNINQRYRAPTVSNPTLRSTNPINYVLSIPSYQSPGSNNSPNIHVSNKSEDLRQKLIIKVEKSAKFYDDPKETKVPTYKTRSKPRGRLLLINNVKFVDEKHVRTGAELDEANLQKLFVQMGFEIDRHRDLNKKEMEKKILNFRNNSSLKRVDIGTVIIMSHGIGKERSDSTEVVCTDGELLETTWIINQFNSDFCPYLSGKPKIFIFQCCRGSSVQTDGIPRRELVPRQVSDMLVAYSTVPGFVSHRDPQHGTWYIQAICKVFMEHAHDTDVESLLKIVDHMLANIVSGLATKQTSSFENRGFRTCYFHPQLYKV